MEYIISMTSVPDRFKDTLPRVISMISENLQGIQIVLSLPKTYRKGWEWDIKDIEHLSGVTVNILDEDYGPATKLLGGIKYVKENKLKLDGIITLDDDILFDNINEVVSDLLESATSRKDEIITSSGLLACNKPFRIGNGLKTVSEQYSHSVAGYMGVFYPSKFWDSSLPFTVIDDLSEGFYSEDDAYFGAVAYIAGIKIWSKSSSKIFLKSITDISAVDTGHGNVARHHRESALYTELVEKKFIDVSNITDKENKVCAVLTSCGRLDLLKDTLNSFILNNTTYIEDFIIIEDSGDKTIGEELVKLNKEKYNSMFTIVLNEEQIGQTASIDKAYDMIKDKCDYIFHCENDWLFYKRGFIEDSMMVLESQPKVLQAWIRPKSDGILNKIEPKIFVLPGGIKVRRVLPASFSTGQTNEDGTPRIVQNYMGFSFNPGLKRVSDYKLIGSYKSKNEEHLVDAFYRDNGYMVVSLSIDDNDGYVKHNGWDNRTENYEV